MRCRGAMGEHGAGPAGQHRRQPVPLGAQRRVADRVDALVEAMQPARAQPVIDGVARHSQRGELAPGQHAPLPLRELRHRQPGGWARFAATIAVFRAHPLSMPTNPLQRTPQTHQLSPTPHPSMPWLRTTANATRTRREPTAQTPSAA
jgi:hypothetical protein